jgi:hypothetical protein
MMKEELFRTATEIRDSISEEQLVLRFVEWMRRLEQVINTDREDI